MKHSLRFRITLILTISIAFLILGCILANQLFLEKFYLDEKIDLLSESYETVNQIAGSDQTDNEDEMINSIEKTEAAYNVSVYIIQDVQSSNPDRHALVYLYPITMEIGNNDPSGIFRFEKYKRISLALQQYIFGSYYTNPSEKYTHLQSLESKYDVYKYFDNEVNSYYIDLVGYLDNDNLIFIRSNYVNIQESANISTRFLTIVGLIVIVIGSIFMFIFTERFTKPLLELADISNKMTNLNFTSKYTDNRKDEIGKLGNSINTLSDKLEATIKELKAANIELEKDLQNKTEIDEMRKEFLSNVSHELKTPIALIQGYAEGLQDNINDDPESRSFYCDVIIDESRKMNKMVKKLLSLNEIEFGRDKVDFEHFDIIALTSSVVSSIDILAKQKNAQVILNPYKPTFVWADSGMIEEVITNYLSNALNHLGGQNIIDISFKEYNNKIRISVFNTGENIADEDLDKIWIKFYKVDKARTREYGGSGIGLSIVKAIMEHHNQNFGVENHSTGVEFWFELDTKITE